jgi:ABC-2 type transport system permease protein
MRNFWLIARHEYRKMVMRKGFLVSIIGIPLLIFVIMGVSIYVNTSGRDNRPVGYVDQAGIIVNTVQDPEARIQMIGYPNQDAAYADLEAQQIQAFYVLPAGYPRTTQAELYYWDEAPAEGTQNSFRGFVKRNLVAGLPQDVQTRLIEGSALTVHSMDGSRKMSEESFLAFILPFFGSIMFIFVVMTSASYLLQVVADEKENRTIEILLTSLSPEQLIGGKAVGLMGVALTQLGLWLLTGVIGLVIAVRFFDLTGMENIPWDFVIVIIAFFIPAYALVAGIMTAIGGAITELRQGQQIAGMINMLFLLPVFLLVLIMSNPSSPLVMFMTFFPTTSFMTISLRWGMSVLPFWQLILSWMILVSTAVFSVWASARIFRTGMLRYGQQMNLSGIFAALRKSKSLG